MLALLARGSRSAMDLVTAYPVDQRVAPDGDPDRNAGMLEALSAGAPSMPVTATERDRACRRYAERLPDRLDVVHLGLGDDGHTASWPPADPVIDAKGAVAMSGEYKGRVRMTLTVHAVNAARRRMVLATGEPKAEAVERWMLHDPDVPINRVSRTGTLVVLDTDAAARLPYQDR